eukprot:GSChrysophyteH1.ASY1.ANO1.2840.1 assembled CDS
MESQLETPKTVLVTGGAGFIGSHVADSLLERGDKVICVYEGDICDEAIVDKIFTTEAITHVCHLAARAGVRPSIMDPYIYVHSNVEGTTRLLDYSRKHDIQNFVYASSSSVYGSSPKEELLTEDDVVDNPVSPYAATKKTCELLAYTFNHLYALPCTGLRFFTVYGPRGRPDMAPFKFIDRVFKKKTIQQYGDGTTSRDYTYITDIVAGVISAIDRPLGYEVINLGNGRPFQLSKFIELVEKCVGEEAIKEILPEQPGDVKHTCASISKAKALLSYEPKVSFEEGIRLTTNWYKTAAQEGLFEEKEVTPNIGIKRTNSDLELSSFVKRSEVRVKKRDRRVF